MRPAAMMRRAAAAFSAALLAALLLASCAGQAARTRSEREIAALSAGPGSWPAARFAVLSDPHLYDTALGTDSPAFREYMANDRKLLPESEELLRTALDRVRESGAQFLLIPGDLTKDGERQDHELMARLLGGLRDAGVSAFVVPGNHDIFNPDARRFTANGAERVPWVTPEEFASVYAGFGYGGASRRDPASLSYAVEPVPGLLLLAVCSADYAGNPKRSEPKTGGRIGTATLRWMEGELAAARRAGTPVIAMMHHGVVEHYRGQAKHYGEYLVDDRLAVADLLASYGVRTVFTGHYHAQDITVERWENGNALYDVETGSLVSFPNAVRNVSVDESGRMRITSSFITSLPSFEERGVDFAAYSRDFLMSGIGGIAVKTMKGLGVPEGEAAGLAPKIAEAFLAHYAGDERFTGTEMLPLSGLGFMGGIVVGMRRDLVAGLWQDLEPPDNDLVIDLAGGGWSAAQ
jgi:hypothetical protein